MAIVTEHGKDSMQQATRSNANKQAQPATVALFISDLHLTATMPKTAQAFFDLLTQEASRAQQLYLLGDIFEYWAGDDDLGDPFHQQVCAELKAVAARGVHIYWIAGNRDFLVGHAFATAAGLTLLHDPHVAELAGQRLLLLHGDAQCIDDTAYMAFRAQVRNPEWQSAFLSRPLAERKALIAGMREGSREAQKEKSMAIMDVNPAEIERLFDAHDIKLMIHGHTHRPDIHQTAGGTRYVLPDWDCDGDALRGGWIALGSDGKLRTVAISGS